MAGGNQTNQQQQLTPQQQQIITSLHKAAGEDGTYKLSREEFLEQSRQYHSTMVVGRKKAEILGVQNIHTVGIDFTTQSIQIHENIHAKNRLEAEKEASYNEKKSKQEEAAISRGEYSDYKTDKSQAARNALTMYNQYLANPAAAQVQTHLPKGDEFEQNAGDTDAVVTQKIYDMMLSRKLLSDQVDILKRTKPLAPELKVFLKYYTKLLACTDDAIYTWNIANGVDPDDPQKQVSEKAVNKAKHHLPLALEKYKYECTSGQAVLGRQIVEAVRSSAKWKSDEDAEKQQSLISDAQARRVHGINGSFRGEMDALQTYITQNPAAYKQNKKQIDKAFAKFTAYLRRATDLRWNSNGAGGWLSLAYPQGTGNAVVRRKIDAAFNAMRSQDFTEISMLTFQAESERDYIHFLLSGGTSKTDQLHGRYIESEYGTKAYDQDPHLPLKETLTEFQDAQRDYNDRLQELQQEIAGQQDPVRKRRLQEVYDKLRPAEDKNPIEKALALSVADDNAIMIADIQSSLAQTVPFSDEMQKPGFRDVVCAFTQIGKAPSMSTQEAVRVSSDLLVAKTGNSPDGEEVDDDEKNAAYDRLLTDYAQNIAELADYMDKNPEMLRERMPQTMFSGWRKLPEFYARAKAVASGMTIIIESPLFLNLSKGVQQNVLDDYIKVRAMAGAAGGLLEHLQKQSEKSADEYLRYPEWQDLGRVLYSFQLSECRDRFIIYGNGSFQRSYAP